MPEDRKIVIIGAGPAGLTAAYVLGKRGAQSTVLEADTVVGGSVELLEPTAGASTSVVTASSPRCRP
jgi:phytoene dehydrogenase-like protein